MNNPFDRAYHDLLRRILNEGVEKKDRTGTGTLSVFGHMMRFDLTKGFPLITTKKIHLKSIIHELLWMLSGSTNIKYLNENGVTIWDEWADADGELGPVYGSQWRAWPGRTSLQQNGRQIVALDTIDPGPLNAVTRLFDQIEEIVETLRKNPWSRRIMLSAWNVAEVPKMKLPPCHFNAQFNVTPATATVSNGVSAVTGGASGMPHRLNCLMNIRSWDVFLGGPFNIAQYALLTMMLAQVCDLEPGELVIASGDTHLYLNHLEQARMQLEREPRDPPTMTIDPRICQIDDFVYENFKLGNYDPHPHIKAEVSV